ncbi:hypothetical protein PVK06_039123 [Gossypium arboreum]|uniref:Reverse transcriptase domain-containing protein n=1 Tax=Gossypium arboreum TaxID=29729 RepID=A0ABR0N202_GOSAR|nr:hypothetical protein PVK06_039123 [Gossypium arboreum]
MDELWRKGSEVYRAWFRNGGNSYWNSLGNKASQKQSETYAAPDLVSHGNHICTKKIEKIRRKCGLQNGIDVDALGSKGNLSLGWKNTLYLHSIASAKKKINTIRDLKNDSGEWVRDEKIMANIDTNYFKELFTTFSTGDSTRTLMGIQPCINEVDNVELAIEFKDEKVEEAIKSMSLIKASRENNFLTLFFQKYWSIVGLENINRTNIVLIPKNTLPTTMTQFRPISLCNVLYKIFSKANINRFITVLDKSTVTYSVIFNGEQDDVFKPSRGLWQGDPLSLYLFLICIEGF